MFFEFPRTSLAFSYFWSSFDTKLRMLYWSVLKTLKSILFFTTKDDEATFFLKYFWPSAFFFFSLKKIVKCVIPPNFISLANIYCLMSQRWHFFFQLRWRLILSCKCQSSLVLYNSAKQTMNNYVFIQPIQYFLVLQHC